MEMYGPGAKSPIDGERCHSQLPPFETSEGSLSSPKLPNAYC